MLKSLIKQLLEIQNEYGENGEYLNVKIFSKGKERQLIDIDKDFKNDSIVIDADYHLTSAEYERTNPYTIEQTPEYFSLFHKEI